MQIILKHELRNVLSGKSQVRFGTTIKTVASYLKDGEKTSSAIEDTKRFKSEETKRLEDFITQSDFWITEIDYVEQNYKTTASIVKNTSNLVVTKYK
ncbi:MAG: hypothetical protein V5804_11865 [Mucilaginibacter sp.]|uniref:hypothetical protein n=1 Tax=Mucilaginibacter sp. TaxID=1882438 RepID=UPI0034E5A342